MVFMLDGLLVGVSAAEIESVSSSEGRATGTTASYPDEPGNASRLLLLRNRNGMHSRIRTQGTLRVISVPKSQVVPLPRLCATAGSAPIAVALTEEDQILFLIIDPCRLPYGQAGSTSEAGIISSLQESR